MFRINVAKVRKLTSAGIGSPCRNCWNRKSACSGRCSGTSCPAPRTVTKVSPSYSMLQPPTWMSSWHHSHILRSKYIYSGHGAQGDSLYLWEITQDSETLTSVGTMYQGYQLLFTGRPRAARECLVALSGTAVSVSPLQMKRHACILVCCREIGKKLSEETHSRWGIQAACSYYLKTHTLRSAPMSSL